MDKEIWKDIQGYEGLYQVSDIGNVMRVKSGRVLKPILDKDGYHLVGLCRECVRKSYKVHRLVALAFISNLDNKEQVNHIDGVKTNNSLSNLEWCTPRENQIHSVEVLGNQLGPKGKFGSEHNRSKTVVQLTKEGVEIKTYGSTMEARRETGVNRGNISSACLGKLNTAGGFVWRYA